MRTATAMLAVTILLAGTTACDRGREVLSEGDRAVEDARSRADDLTATVRFCTRLVRLTTQVTDRDVQGAARTADQLAADAPAAIREELTTVVEAVRASRRRGDPAPLASREVRSAVAAIRRYAGERCDPGSR